MVHVLGMHECYLIFVRLLALLNSQNQHEPQIAALVSSGNSRVTYDRETITVATSTYNLTELVLGKHNITLFFKTPDSTVPKT